MCGSPKPPEPVAPPTPIPVRDDQMSARQNTQQMARRAAASGYESTLLTTPRADEAGGTVPVLGS